ncbi:hypothetical protein SNEBB_005219 [Seison nebaliae]|nr:hypothetical protein SNEBB_005219 [Seison nebaliae]
MKIYFFIPIFIIFILPNLEARSIPRNDPTEQISKISIKHNEVAMKNTLKGIVKCRKNLRKNLRLHKRGDPGCGLSGYTYGEDSGSYLRYDITVSILSIVAYLFLH